MRRAPGAPRVPKLRDDGAHGKELATIRHPEWFTEWWYFNVRDPKTGLSFLFMYDVTPLGLGLGAFMALVFGGHAGEVTVFGGGISGLRASPTACRHPDTAGVAQSETPPSASQTPLPTNRTTRAAVTVRAGGVPSSSTTTACTVAAPSRFEWMATTSPSPRTALHDGAQPTDSTRNDGATFAPTLTPSLSRAVAPTRAQEDPSSWAARMGPTSPSASPPLPHARITSPSPRSGAWRRFTRQA